MFYGKESIQEQFALVKDKLSQQELFIFIPMPEYKLNERWNDEFRIRDGHTKLADGSWVTVVKMTDYLEKLQKNTEELYDNSQKCYRELETLKPAQLKRGYDWAYENFYRWSAIARASQAPGSTHHESEQPWTRTARRCTTPWTVPRRSR